jgi:hypothetical protein
MQFEPVYNKLVQNAWLEMLKSAGREEQGEEHAGLALVTNEMDRQVRKYFDSLRKKDFGDAKKLKATMSLVVSQDSYNSIQVALECGPVELIGGKEDGTTLGPKQFVEGGWNPSLQFSLDVLALERLFITVEELTYAPPWQLSPLGRHLAICGLDANGEDWMLVVCCNWMAVDTEENSHDLG